MRILTVVEAADGTVRVMVSMPSDDPLTGRDVGDYLAGLVLSASHEADAG